MINCRSLSLLFLILAAWPVNGQDDEPSQTEYSAAGADTCLGCHNADNMLVIFRTPHGQQTDPESPMAQLQCETCHGPGGTHSGRRKPSDMHSAVINFGNDAATPMADQNAVCMGCHNDVVSLAWAGSMHERNDTGCVGCHSVHTATDPVQLQAAQANVCFDCHDRQRADSLKLSAHPIRSDQHVRTAAMVCTDCHSPHASVSSGQLIRDTTNELCVVAFVHASSPGQADHIVVTTHTHRVLI